MKAMRPATMSSPPQPTNTHSISPGCSRTSSDVMLTLPLVNPRRWGWTACGGVTDLTPHHEQLCILSETILHGLHAETYSQKCSGGAKMEEEIVRNETREKVVETEETTSPSRNCSYDCTDNINRSGMCLSGKELGSEHVIFDLDSYDDSLLRGNGRNTMEQVPPDLDINRNWNPSTVAKISICFPLGEATAEDSNTECGKILDCSEELKIKEYFHDVIVCDIGSLTALSPSDIATNIACEYGLSCHEFVDLRQSIERQIKRFVTGERGLGRNSKTEPAFETSTHVDLDTGCDLKCVMSRNCHICHNKKELAVVFGCGSETHVYCDFHCQTRLGFSYRDVSAGEVPDKLKFCPICTLKCECAQCCRKLGKKCKKRTTVGPVQKKKRTMNDLKDSSCKTFHHRPKKHVATTPQDDLAQVWREQSRRRCRGEWAPSGTWRPPSWARTSHENSHNANINGTHSTEKVQDVTSCSSETNAENSTIEQVSSSSQIHAAEKNVPAVTKLFRPRDKQSKCHHGHSMVRQTASLVEKYKPTMKTPEARSTNRSYGSGNRDLGDDRNARRTESTDIQTNMSDSMPRCSSLRHVRCAEYVTPTDHLLVRAHAAVHALLPHGDCESLNVARLADSYHRHWRPEQVRVILLAESHVFTDENRAFRGPKLDYDVLPEAQYCGPRDFLSLVYCLSYGEDEALEQVERNGEDALEKKEDNKGTPQFWSLLAACARDVAGGVAKGGKGLKKNNIKSAFAADLLKGGGLSVKDRLRAKVELLKYLKLRGIWLLDTSVVGWYISQPTEYGRSRKTQEVHRLSKKRPPNRFKAPTLVLSWELYTKHLVREAAEEGQLRLLVPIGMEVTRALTRERLEDAVSVRKSPDAPRVRVANAFPAPNAWIPGGYGPFYEELARRVHEAAPNDGGTEENPTPIVV